MDVVWFFADPLAFRFMQYGLIAGVLVGVLCAVMGTFVVLKGLAFIGDAVSHATFPGLVIAYMLGLPLYIGGAVAAVAVSLAIGAVSRRGRLRFDTAVGVLFAGSFAFGILLFSTIKNYVSDLLGYLLGNVLGIGFGDLVQVAILGALVLVVVLALRKELFRQILGLVTSIRPVTGFACNNAAELVGGPLRARARCSKTPVCVEHFAARAIVGHETPKGIQTLSAVNDYQAIACSARGYVDAIEKVFRVERFLPRPPHRLPVRDHGT